MLVCGRFKTKNELGSRYLSKRGNSQVNRDGGWKEAKKMDRHLVVDVFQVCEDLGETPLSSPSSIRSDSPDSRKSHVRRWETSDDESGNRKLKKSATYWGSGKSKIRRSASWWAKSKTWTEPRA